MPTSNVVSMGIRRAGSLFVTTNDKMLYQELDQARNHKGPVQIIPTDSFVFLCMSKFDMQSDSQMMFVLVENSIGWMFWHDVDFEHVA